MSADAILYCLERVSDYRDFERLCSSLLAGMNYPEIDPLGGTGDKGRDAIVRTDSAGRKICFAFTVRSDWRVKLLSDAKRIYEMSHAPDVFVFVCTESLSASDKDFAHKSITEGYGWELDLFDIERLRVQLVGPQRHLIAHHPSIFAPPFFPQRGGESIAESKDTLIIDHVAADTGLATWLARRLSLAGFRTWCNGTAPLAGENVDVSVRKLLEVRAILYLPIITISSLSDGVFLERCTIAATKEGFVLPCGTTDSRSGLPSRLVDLMFADFHESWKIGLSQVLKQLTSIGINASLDPERGKQIALRDYLPVQVTVSKPEPVIANVFDLQLPEVMFIFDYQIPPTVEELDDARKQWAFASISEYQLAAFTYPPNEIFQRKTSVRTSKLLWRDSEERHGVSLINLAKQLVWRSLDLVCAEKGLQYCDTKKLYYFPKPKSGEWVQKYKHIDERRTDVQLTGTRTKGWGVSASPFFYQLAPKFRPQGGRKGAWNVIVSIYVRVTTLDGQLFEAKEIGRRRKVVTKSWWNPQWLARLLGMTQALETSNGCIQIGEGTEAVIMTTTPTCWECPIGLDVVAVTGLPDIGQEIAEYKAREDEYLSDEGTEET